MPATRNVLAQLQNAVRHSAFGAQETADPATQRTAPLGERRAVKPVALAHKPPQSNTAPPPIASSALQDSLFGDVGPAVPPLPSAHGPHKRPHSSGTRQPEAGAARSAAQPQRMTPQLSADTTQGHRARLRARFDCGETLADYELLELVLFRAIPRRDTKPVAKAMIAAFGSFAGAVSTSAARLQEIDGVGERVVSDLRLIKVAAERFALGELKERQNLSSTDAVVEYYRIKLQGASREEFHLLFLDKKNQFLASECAVVGTVDHTPVYPREVVALALSHGASAVVLVHNHPSGDPTPSRADVAMTRQIMDASAPVGVHVHDHIIIAGPHHLSLRGEGYI